jgi:DNA-binding NtrC family response regulator
MTSAVAPGLILLVDDDPDLLALLRRVLVAAGFPVVSTTDPQGALEILTREDVRVLVSDVDMPEMNGTQLVAAARRIRPHAVRMLLTGRANLDAAIAGINDGEIFRFLTKPFDPPTVVRLVGEARARSLELEQAAELQGRAAARRRATAELEAFHPGITEVDRDASGVYLARPEQARRLARMLGLDALLQETG